MITVENLSKSYGSQVLFDGIGFRINDGERVGLVGRNGHGKTTLLRLLAGEEEPDSGAVTVPRGCRIGYVRQHLSFTQPSVRQECALGLPPDERHAIWKAEQVLAGLGFSTAAMDRPPAAFSGGYQVRLNLATVLVSEPDLLLLDEPTNYLDITSIRWVEQFLAAWPRSLVLITHDRAFMDAVVTCTLGIHRRGIRKIRGGTDKYYEQIAQDEEVYERTRLNDERRRKDMELFISRFRAKARLANLVQSRIKALERQTPRDKLEQIHSLEFSFRSCPFTARVVLRAEHLQFGYTPDRNLIANFSLTVDRGERICIVGPNGRGKTTLLRLLAGSLTPSGGTIRAHAALQAGVFEQTNLSRLVGSRTVEEEVLYSSAQVDNQAARDACGAMMFPGDDALKRISVLSGGEKSRVMLAKLLVTPVNLLLLDEPTNHLDMQSCDALLAALADFDGTLIMVTHNELFLHALAQRLVVFDGSGITVFDGSYQEFLDRGGWEPAQQERSVQSVDTPRMTRKLVRKRRSEVVTERGRVLNPLADRMQTLETRIGDEETRMSELHAALAEASGTGDGGRIAALARDLHAVEQQIDQWYAELDRLTTAHEQESARFDRMLSELAPDEGP